MGLSLGCAAWAPVDGGGLGACRGQPEGGPAGLFLHPRCTPPYLNHKALWSCSAITLRTLNGFPGFVCHNLHVNYFYDSDRSTMKFHLM